MESFDERWRECVRVARVGWEPPTETVWVSLRTVVRAGAGAGMEEEMVGWWRWYGARGLAVASVVLAVCWIFAVRVPRESALRPGVEDAVAEAVWSL